MRNIVKILLIASMFVGLLYSFSFAGEGVLFFSLNQLDDTLILSRGVLEHAVRLPFISGETLEPGNSAEGLDLPSLDEFKWHRVKEAMRVDRAFRTAI